MRTLKVDIEGLDLVLGGGFSLLERVEGAGESTTLLIRGPAGSGKTVLGTQFAVSIARALGTDVAYGCVELLPVELRAQYEGVRPKGSTAQVVLLNEDDTKDPGPDHVRVCAGLLDLGEDGRTVERLGDSLESLLDAADHRAKRKTRVMVVDSLSDGYGLGARAPRILADGVSKFAAERGLVMILLEEQADEGPSVWSFAVDAVFELKSAEKGLPFGRRLWIPKNRLGPSDPGPHEFVILPQKGAWIFPRANAYQMPWGNELLRRGTPATGLLQPWYPEEFLKVRGLPDFRTSTVSVVGGNSVLVRRLALMIGSRGVYLKNGAVEERLGAEIEFKVGIAGSPLKGAGVVNVDINRPARVGKSWSPMEGGTAVLADLRTQIENQHVQNKIPLRVVIGDLRDVRHHANGQDVVQSIAVIASLLKDLGIPLVLYETTDGPQPESVAMAHADVLVTCMSDHVDVARGASLMMVRVDGPSVSDICTIPVR